MNTQRISVLTVLLVIAFLIINGNPFSTKQRVLKKLQLEEFAAIEQEEDCDEVEVKSSKNKERRIYKADIQKGIIGHSTKTPVDNAFDNVFHIFLDKQPTEQDEILLTYSIKGVANHTSIARSINDRTATGGYLIEQSDTWSLQKEHIPSHWLKRGDNVVRFSLPEDLDIRVSIKNIALRVNERVEEKQQPEIIINTPHEFYFDDKAYLKGFIKGVNPEKAILFANGIQLQNSSGEFEYVFEKPENLATDYWTIQLKALFPNRKVVTKEITLLPKSEPVLFVGATLEKGNPIGANYSPTESQKITTDGLTIALPVQALAKSSEITITPLRNIDLAPLSSEIVNVTGKNKGYRLLPHGTNFLEPVELTIAYDKTLIPDGYTPEDIRTYFFDEKDRKWKSILKDKVHISSSEITSVTTHFTDFINGIIKVPESPETNGYTPTSIKDLKSRKSFC